VGGVQFPGGQSRTLEDLKDRYYSIARKLMMAREGTDSTLLNQLLLRQPYNANQGGSDSLCAVADAQ
jgi:DNA methyltransferase 1-associated protein 1